MANLAHVRTPVLEIAYEDNGPRDGVPVVLLHGCPYSLDPKRTFAAIAIRAFSTASTPLDRRVRPATLRCSRHSRPMMPIPVNGTLNQWSMRHTGLSCAGTR